MSTMPRAVQIAVDDKTYTGTCKVFDDTLSVTYGVKTKSTQVNGLSHEWLEAQLLLDLVRESNKGAKGR